VNEEQKQTLDSLAARRWRVAITLTAVMLAVYFGFILLVAFDKPLMGRLILGGRISVGIVLGAAVIAVAPLLTAVYVRWANRIYDPELHALRHAMASATPAPVVAGEPAAALPIPPPTTAPFAKEARP